MSQVRQEDAERGEYTLSSPAFAVDATTIRPYHLACHGFPAELANRIPLTPPEAPQNLRDTSACLSALNCIEIDRDVLASMLKQCCPSPAKSRF